MTAGRPLAGAVIAGLTMLVGSASSATVSAAAAPPQPAGAQGIAYAGKTSQARPLSLNLFAQGLKFSVGWSGRCNDGGRPFVGTTFNSRLVPVTRGRFNVASTFSDQAADRVPVTYTVRMTGAIKGKAASGTWRMVATGPDTMGGRWRCDTGALTWSARSGTGSGAPSLAGRPLAANSLGLQTNTSSKGRRPAPTVTLSGQVLYGERECYKGSVLRMLPLAGATVRLDPAGANPVEATLDAQGRFQDVVVHDANRIDAYAITDGPRVRVAPDTDGAQPYLLPLGEVRSSGQVFRIGGSVGNVPPDMLQGAANIYGTLDEAARIARPRSPVAIPKIRARWRYGLGGNWLGDRQGSAYDATNNTIYVGGRLSPTDGDVSGSPEPAASARDEYEHFPLMHEYAHHVLEAVAAAPGSAGGDHEWSGVYPDNPGLAWSEGFANAFAAIADEKAQETLGCTTRVNLAAEPAAAESSPGFMEPMPPPPNDHLAQYNEIAVAGAVWHVAKRLGGGNPQAGLAPILRALHQNPAASMRDFADALAEDSLIATTREEFELIAEELRRQGINWGFHINATGAVNGEGQIQTQVKMEGAYSCAVQDALADDRGLLPEDRGGLFWELAGEGGLPHTWHDDCFGTYDGDPQPEEPGGGADNFFVEYPYSGGSDPNEEMTLSVRYVCRSPDPTNHPCSSNFFLTPTLSHGADPTPNSQGLHDYAISHKVDVTELSLNTWVPLMTVDGMGHCTSLIDGFDCSI
jgi:hypothetical protein